MVMLRKLVAASVGILATAGIAMAHANAPNIEEIVVTAATGSRIEGESESASPLAVFKRETLIRSGMKDLRDFVGTLAMNTGAENNSDNLTQNFTVGTANINLRGLGVASTLVLLNGRRQVLSAAQTDDGSSFVDLAGLLPMLAIDRVEILKDGGAAIYGSEAVAGVANFITRQGFRGVEMQAEYRARTGEGTQDDFTLDGLVGGELGASGEFLLAASFLDRTSLVLIEVDWLKPSTSGFGNPGSFHVPSLGRTIADPGCEAYAGLLQELADGSTLCRFDYGPQITAVPNEQRIQTWGRFDWRLDDETSLSAELGYASNDISRDVSPSFPVLNTPRVPAYHPGNTYQEDIWFQGRPYGFGQPPEVNYYRHETARLALGMRRELSAGSSWDVSLVHAMNDAMLAPRDVIAKNFQEALLGLGGERCDARANLGEGECLFFNPFSSAFTAAPGDPLYNSPELRRFIIGDYLGEGDSELTTFEANLTGSLPVFGAAYALGTQYRRQSLDFTFDPITRQDGFAFLIGNSNFSAQDDVYAVYAEIWLPVLPRLEATLALRYEDYGKGTGDTLDPKLTLLFQATDALSLRGSFSTSFRAPSPFQTQGVQTNFTNIIDHDGSTTFAGRRTLGDPGLNPETSRAYNLGAIWQSAGRASFSVSADLWHYSFEDVLRKDNAQSIVNANPFDPRVERTAAGTISIVKVAFINADAIDTTGFDVSARLDLDTRVGLISAWGEASWLLAYDVTNAGAKVDALGKLNRANVGAPNQELKASVGATLSRGSLDFSALLHHVGDYEDDAGGSIERFTTIDLSSRCSFTGLFGGNAETWVAFGVANVLGEDPPHVAIAGSYDPRSADPRGRRVFLSVGANFN